MNVIDSEQDDNELGVLDQAAAAMPPVLGGGCLSRYDPAALNAESGADYAQAQQLLQLARQSVGLIDD
ncbi:MAG: hypothetical protein M1440_07540 [Gammaproteobacteria bacterium]|nr:hypothetical protein [Gammaproteobacteria bacterium]